MAIFDKALHKFYGLSSDIFYRRFVRDSERAAALNEEILGEILRANAQTAYGQLHNFTSIKGSLAYKQAVPLTDYRGYEKFIDEIAAGSEGILTAEPVRYFGLSSGTTGKQKRIPVTAKSQQIVNLNMMFTQQGLLRHALPTARSGGKGLLLMNMLQAGSTGSGIPMGSGTSGGVTAMQKVFPYFWVSPLAVLQIADQPTANYLHLLFALQEKTLAYIGAPFPSAIVQLLAVLEANSERLAEDLATGRIDSTIELEPQTRTSLENLLRPNPQRAGEVTQACRQGMEGIIPRLWPQMTYLSCVIGGSFSIYVDRLRRLAGRLPIYSAVYGATEALIGLATDVDSCHYVLAPRAAYFEFIPLNQAGSDRMQTLSLAEVATGEYYELVLTNYAGFYRYRLGDVVKIVGRFSQAPVLEFSHRQGQLLNLAGEKTSEAAMLSALRAAAAKFDLDIIDFCVAEDMEPLLAGYKVFLELNDSEIPAQELRNVLEAMLEEANPRYAVNLQAKRLRPLRLELVNNGTFSRLQAELVARGASQAQVKIPRLIRDQKLLALLNAAVRQSSNTA